MTEINNLIIGVHCNKVSKINDKSNSLSQSIKDEMDHFDLNAAQIFVANPHTGIVSDITHNTKDIVDSTTDIDLTVHSAYTTVGIWKINKDTVINNVLNNILNKFIFQIKICKIIKAWCFVIHLPKKPISDIKNTMEFMLLYAKKYNIKIGLEMPSYKSGPLTYETPQKLNQLVSNTDYFGIVVDTAHLWGAGIDVSGYNVMNQWLNNMNKIICMFHLNGSFSDKGSGKDKHAIPFSSEDKIWHNVNPKQSGLYAVVEYSVKYKIPIICEINRGTNDEIHTSMNIIKKLALDVK